MGVPGFPENVKPVFFIVGGAVRVPKIPNLRVPCLIFLSLKLGTCLYDNGQCLGVPGYPENVVRVLNFLLGAHRVP